MPKIAPAAFTKKKATISKLREARLPWWNHWRDLANFYLPRRYTWLLSPKERAKKIAKNEYILDGSGTLSARTLASGMMNGITSPSRPWFKLRLVGFRDDEDSAIRIWLDEIERRMMLVMAESNFYNALAVMYLDLVVFGTASMLIYEDFESVIRCYNCSLGEFYLAQSARHEVNTFAREFSYDVHQMAERWGRDNLTQQTRTEFDRGGTSLYIPKDIVHIIEPNLKDDAFVPGGFRWREMYWEATATDGQLLDLRGFNEFPVIAPRWELSGNDSYGSSPAMDALGDVIQLQHETKKKAQGLDKMVSPPVIADIQLQNKPTSLLPNGTTFVAGVNNVGVKPIYTVNPPIAELSADISQLQLRIGEFFHNSLFRMISQLETVRSATEIDARREEKLVLLGPVLERFENEALDPAISRIFAIMSRSGLIPEAPEDISEAELEIQYVSILAAAQSATSTVPLERWLTLIGNVTPLYPQAVNIPNWEELIRTYGKDLGVGAKNLRSPAETAKQNKADAELASAREAAAEGSALVDSAQSLSQTDVGGGRNALQTVLGG